MKYYALLLTTGLIFALSCKQAAPPVSADLEGFELTQVPGSAFYQAVKIVDSIKVQEGYVLDGRKNGVWLDYAPDGKISLIQHYVDGKLNGPSITLDTRWQVTARADYTDGRYDGVKATYKFGRPEEEVMYRNGEVDGLSKKYYQTGKLMEEAEYSNNQLNGYYRHYNETGEKDLEYEYRNGEKISGGIVVKPAGTSDNQ